MDKLEKVIKGLDCCAKDKCEACPYYEPCHSVEFSLCAPLAKDALKLLKAKELLRRLKFVDVDAFEERACGRWTADSDGLPACSVCGEVAMQRLYCDTLHTAWVYDIRLVKTPYCPRCGARMEGKTNG